MGTAGGVRPRDRRIIFSFSASPDRIKGGSPTLAPGRDRLYVIPGFSTRPEGEAAGRWAARTPLMYAPLSAVE